MAGLVRCISRSRGRIGTSVGLMLDLPTEEGGGEGPGTLDDGYPHWAGGSRRYVH